MSCVRAVRFSVIAAVVSMGAVAGAAPEPSDWSDQVVYQIFERSFFDSNGDRVGDFNGIVAKLPYLSRLGVTAILLQPIFKSGFYHNYFADDFFSADPSLGGTAGFFKMVHAAHQRHIRVILDMEVQYVAGGHPWFGPGSGMMASGTSLFGQAELPTYKGTKIPVATVNLKAPAVVSELRKCFRFWAAPGGKREDGVDGFRIDHMMDDLDGKHLNTNLLAGLWAPLEADVRALKPGAFFVAEQADWSSLGEPQFQAGGVDAVYAIPLRGGLLRSLQDQNARAVGEALMAEQSATPTGKTQLVVLEDHDVERFATAVGNDAQLERLGAAFQLFIKGTPSIYYGQELGMQGTQLRGRDDGNDIPLRLAMPWMASATAAGTATWYGKGPWTQWASANESSGVSVQAEASDPGSIFRYYQRLIGVRRSHPAILTGSQRILRTTNASVLVVVRELGHQSIAGAFNFSHETQRFRTVAYAGFEGRDLISGEKFSAEPDGTVILPPGGSRWIQLKS